MSLGPRFLGNHFGTPISPDAIGAEIQLWQSRLVGNQFAAPQSAGAQFTNFVASQRTKMAGSEALAWHKVQDQSTCEAPLDPSTLSPVIKCSGNEDDLLLMLLATSGSLIGHIHINI